MAVEHYAPWGKYLFGKDQLHPVVNYTLGLGGVIFPLSFLALTWQFEYGAIAPWLLILALWLHAIAAGLAVGGFYLWDSVHAERTRRQEAEERERLSLRQDGLS